MPSRSYANFDVRLYGSGGAFTSRVIHSPVGEAGPVPFVVPFSDERLEMLLMRLEPWRIRTRRVPSGPSGAAQELGASLFEALFRDGVRDALFGSLSAAREGLRLRIDLTEAPQLAGLPWELLFDPVSHRPLALSEKTPIVRFLRLPGSVPPVPLKGPLKVLMVLSSPAGLDPLDLDAESSGIQADLADQVAAGVISIDRLDKPRLADLHRYLRGHEVHVLHLVGHGDFDRNRQDGVLYLEDRLGNARAVSSEELGPVLFDHDPLRLVVLNACQTASSDRTDAFSGLAQGLVQQGIPAVVAMQVPITDDAATCFSRDFYTALAMGNPVDQALTGARKAVATDFGYEWATPVLFLRIPDADLFSIAPARSTQSPTRAGTDETPDAAGRWEAAPPSGQTTQQPPHRNDRAPAPDVSSGGEPRNTATPAAAAPARKRAARGQKKGDPSPRSTGRAKPAQAGPTKSADRRVSVPAATNKSNAPTRYVRNPATGEQVPMRVREAPVNPAAADKAMRFQYLANGGALTSITWGKFIAALPSMLPAPNSYVILNRARHSADTWILLRRTDDALAMEYRYGSPARQYASPPVTLEEALRVIHAFLQPPSDAAQRHHAIVAWTHVGPEHGDAFGVPELRNSYSQAGRTPSGSTGDGRQLSLARVRYDVRITSGGSSPTTTIQVRVGAQRNELVIAHDFLTVNKSYRVAVRKGAWTEFPLEVSGDANPGVTVRAAFRPAGWLTAAKLRLGDTIVSLASNSSGVAQALQTWRDL